MIQMEKTVFHNQFSTLKDEFLRHLREFLTSLQDL